MKAYTFHEEVWLYPGETASWHFISLPKELAESIRAKHGSTAKGWGSLPVEATIGKTAWKTSIFPDKKEGTYLLPVKADVRKREGISAGDMVQVALSVNP